MRTRLSVEVDYDPSVTDPEGLAVAADRLLETACSIPGVLDEYANPTFGEFLVGEPKPGGMTLVVSVSGGVVQDVFSSHPSAQVVIVDWDTHVEFARLGRLQPNAPHARR